MIVWCKKVLKQWEDRPIILTVRVEKNKGERIYEYFCRLE